MPQSDLSNHLNERGIKKAHVIFNCSTLALAGTTFTTIQSLQKRRTRPTNSPLSPTLPTITLPSPTKHLTSTQLYKSSNHPKVNEKHSTIATISSNNRGNRRQPRAPHGYVAGLSPEGQVNKVVADINNFKNGDDLSSWSASARKELTPALMVPLQVGSDASSCFYVPKLALIVASPVARAYFQQKPDATTAKFVHADISLEVMKDIAKWLKVACLKPEIPEMEMPENVKDTMKLRLTAQTLSIDKYVKRFDYYNSEDIEYRVPDTHEITAVVDHTRKDDDPILVALANRLSYHKISHSLESDIAKPLTDK